MADIDVGETEAGETEAAEIKVGETKLGGIRVGGIKVGGATGADLVAGPSIPPPGAERAIASALQGC